MADQPTGSPPPGLDPLAELLIRMRDLRERVDAVLRDRQDATAGRDKLIDIITQLTETMAALGHKVDAQRGEIDRLEREVAGRGKQLGRATEALELLAAQSGARTDALAAATKHPATQQAISIALVAGALYLAKILGVVDLLVTP